MDRRFTSGYHAGLSRKLRTKAGDRDSVKPFVHSFSTLRPFLHIVCGAKRTRYVCSEKKKEGRKICIYKKEKRNGASCLARCLRRSRRRRRMNPFSQPQSKENETTSWRSVCSATFTLFIYSPSFICSSLETGFPTKPRRLTLCRNCNGYIQPLVSISLVVVKMFLHEETWLLLKYTKIDSYTLRTGSPGDQSLCPPWQSGVEIASLFVLSSVSSGHYFRTFMWPNIACRPFLRVAVTPLSSSMYRSTSFVDFRATLTDESRNKRSCEAKQSEAKIVKIGSENVWNGSKTNLSSPNPTELHKRILHG